MSMKENNERVRKAYLKSGLTYDDLAVLTGVKRNTLACWITGKRQPTDIMTSLIEERVSVYLNGGGEYINKGEYRDGFVRRVNEICESVPPEKRAMEIIREFDRLPTVALDAEYQRKRGQCDGRERGQG